KLEDQRILIMGAGAAGIGIGRLLLKTISYLQPDKNVLAQVAITDSTGLITVFDEKSDPYKKDFLWSQDLLDQYKIEDTSNLLHLVEQFKPSVLIGTSGQPGLFSQDIVNAMQKYNTRPVIMPFSNPDTLSEAKPEDLIQWTNGKALVAAGSPFPAFTYDNKSFRISQGNNVFIFPGVGLGALLAQAKHVSSKMFYLASKTLSEQVTPEELAQGMLFPHITRLREITREIAITIILDHDAKTTRAQAEEKVDQFMWEPTYPTLIAEK
ncbi:MAG: hypothetical protein KDK51_10540, partial [Deltaproteobacteria bacterium]|nr:hypothetical protein [Deltaproteobacteria bacterium]